MTSKIKVDNISDQNDNNIINESGDVITVGAAGDTVAVAGNIVKSNAYQASDGGNIASQSGTTITLGASGDTISLASGASQSGFGRTGTVDWQTGSIKTATFTAANGEGYFANTSGGAFTMNLPAGTAGNIVSVVDYTNTFQTNNLTIAPNGSQKIGGTNSSFTASTEGQSLTFVYVDDTEGWKNVQDSTSNAVGVSFITATGGNCISTVCTNFKVHKFTGPGTFTVCSVGTCGNNKVDYMIIAGGGGAGYHYGAGGGAGGFRESKTAAVSGCWTASPLVSSCTVTVTAQGYPIVIGAGGTSGINSAPSYVGSKGSDSSALGKTSTGGGYGGGASGGVVDGGPGGSGGGAGGQNPGGTGGSGNSPPVSPPQGKDGGSSSGPNNGRGGGGASTAAPPGNRAGGDGVTTNISGSPVALAGGGSAGPGPTPAPTGGTAYHGAAGANTGAGGGGDSQNPGGSGIVIIRYKFQ
jgi:hypothetical protein